jgi:hypothetical protein
MMRKHLHVFLTLLIVAAAAISPSARVARAASAAPLVVIMASSVGISDIPSSTLLRIFQGEHEEYQGGKSFVPFNSPAGSEGRTLFDRRVLGLTPDDVGRFWIDRRIRGEAQPPRTLPSVDLAVRVTATLPGAITYLRANLVGSGVRVLTIDGRSSNHQDYLLRDR